MTMSPGFASISDERSAPDGVQPRFSSTEKAPRAGDLDRVVRSDRVKAADLAGDLRGGEIERAAAASERKALPLRPSSSNSSVEAPEISSVPLPATAPCRSSVAGVTSIVPVLVTAGAIALAPVPPVFSSRPATGNGAPETLRAKPSAGATATAAQTRPAARRARPTRRARVRLPRNRALWSADPAHAANAA